MNALSTSIHGNKLIPYYSPPAKYTGDVIGVQYLYEQSGQLLCPTDDKRMDALIDEGFEERDIDHHIADSSNISDFPENLIINLPDHSDDDDEEENVRNYCIFCKA